METETDQLKGKSWDLRFVEFLDRLMQASRYSIFFLAVVLTASVYALVYATGGIRYVYSHFMYIPVLLAGFSYGPTGGILLGLFGGIILGPFMPIDVATGEQQELTNWLCRMVFFMMIGALTGIWTNATRKQVDRIKWHSRHDPASGLKNRFALLEDLTSGQYAEGDSRPKVLALFSLANAEEIQSTFGSTIMDDIIFQLAKRIETSFSVKIRPYHVYSDLVAILFYDRNISEVEELLETLTEEIRRPFKADGLEIHGEILIAASDVSELIQDPELYLRDTQAELQRGIRRSRKPTSMVRLAKHSTAEKNLKLLADLRKTLDNDQGLLTVHYQPKISISTGHIVGAEALIRWKHPELGNIPPADFISSAEKSTLIDKLTSWILEIVSAQQELWQKNGIDIPVSVNISANNLIQEDFPQTVFQALDYHGIEGRSLELEITETAAMQNPDDTMRAFQNLSQHGVRFSIDDFGTGFSCLRYLLEIPAYQIKIDQSFVQQMVEQKSARHIVQTSITAAHGLGKQTVAEGVEDENTLAMLREMGCDQAQGFFISRPLPAGEFLEWRKEWIARLEKGPFMGNHLK